MQWSLTVVTTPGPETAQTSVIVHLPKERILFNCPEGFQRVGAEQKQRIFKFSHVFFTQVNWAALGGLFGFVLTLGDASTQGLRLIGGPNLTHTLAAARSFIMRPGFPVNVLEWPHPPVQPEPYRTEELTIVPVLSFPEGYAADDGAVETEGESTPKRPRLSPSTAPAAEIDPTLTTLINHMFRPRDAGSLPLRCLPRPPPTQPRPAAVSYIGTGPDVPGKFDVKACEALKIPKGPWRGKLVKGQDVELPDGRTIQSSQVVSASRPGSTFVICDCPSPAYLASLTRSSAWLPYYTEGGDRTVSCFIHIAGPGVLQDPQYQAWLQRFGPDTEHLFSGVDVNDDAIVFASSAQEQHVLRELDGTVFNGPYQTPAEDTAVWNGLLPHLPARSHLLRPRTGFQFEPKQAYQPEDQVQRYDPARVADDADMATLLAPFRAAVQEFRAHSTSKSLSPPSPDAADAANSDAPSDAFSNLVVSPLGTGSSMPSKYRNVTANLLTIPSRGHVLLDAGENTIGQLYRLLGASPTFNRAFNTSFDQFFVDLHLVFISHMHADHHLGLASILARWNQVTREGNHPRNLTIVGPQPLLTWLAEYDEVEPLGIGTDTHLVNCEWLGARGAMAPAPPADTFAPLQAALGITRLQTCRAIHCPYAYCVTLVHERGWKVAYSGDTRPNPDFIRLGQGADLLIHESTLEDAMLEEAIAKKHCTTSESLQVAKEMKARYTLLSHFSQRYPRAPVFFNLDAASVARRGDTRGLSLDTPGVGVAFDLMSIRMREFERLATYLPVLKALHPNLDSDVPADVIIGA
ncbi:hypothetical protein IWQ60_005658 [Tieghemiomyces parasiticus]|uniref:ribonuclease Z n=1 Tax=Tieghemiomyces parasiticus TaxID=78921 RepID=A0A9W8A6I9_9FUNG|nr:hypothetical protein IWQ60_005658 [Tieghemiomyces parasiticus]